MYIKYKVENILLGRDWNGVGFIKKSFLEEVSFVSVVGICWFFCMSL